VDIALVDSVGMSIDGARYLFLEMEPFAAARITS